MVVALLVIFAAAVTPISGYTEGQEVARRLLQQANAPSPAPALESDNGNTSMAVSSDIDQDDIDDAADDTEKAADDSAEETVCWPYLLYNDPPAI